MKRASCFRSVSRGCAVLISFVEWRTLWIGALVVAGVGAVGVGGYFGIKKLLAHPPHEVVITYLRHAPTLDNDEKLANATARTLATKAAHLKRVRTVSTRDRVTVECSFDSKPLQYDEDDTAIKNTTDQVLHQLGTLSSPPLVEEGEPETRMWVLSNKDLYAQLDELRGVTVWRGCGTVPKKHFRVRLDPTRLTAYKVDPADFVLDLERQVLEGNLQLANLPGLTAKGYITLSKITTNIVEDTQAPSCTTLMPGTTDAAPITALRVKLHPKIAPEDRGKLDAIIKENKATLLEEKDYSEVRFYPTQGATYDQELQLAAKILHDADKKISPIAVTMTNEGVGTLLVKKEAKDADIHDFFSKTDAAWGGIRGRHYVQVTVTAKDRTSVDAAAQALVQKLSKVDGIGQRILTAPPSRPETTYDIDEIAALRYNVDLELLHALLPAVAQEDDQLPLVFEAPLDALMIHGRPLSTFVSTRITLAPARLLSINAAPAIELRWELADSKPMKRIRQIVGESPAVTVAEVSAVR